MRRMVPVAVVCWIAGLATSLPGRCQALDRCPAAARVEVEIVGDERGTLPLRRRECGIRDRFLQGTVEARQGERYRLRVRNRTGERIGLVVAVDGRNIISGERSFLRATESMYVLNPFQTGVFHGWRTGLSRENRFYFTTADDSYASAWGDTSRLGMIEVATFRERPRPIRYEPPPSPPFCRRAATTMERPSDRASKAAAPSAVAVTAAEMSQPSTPGTGFGEEIHSRVREVAFETDGFPVERHLIRYEWPQTCRCCDPPPRFLPDDGRSGFAPPPPGRFD